jgi:hypothetical protein
MQLVEGEVYCEVHTCVHEQTNDPYGYGYDLTDEEPECGPGDWRKLWIGGKVEEGQDDV